MALESMQWLARRLGCLCAQQEALDSELKNWKRRADNDPYKRCADTLAERISAQTGYDVIAGYNEFCAPTISLAIDEAVDHGSAQVIVDPTMTMRGGRTLGNRTPPYCR